MDFLLHFIAVTAISAPHVLGYSVVIGKGKILHFGPLAVSIVAAYGVFLTTLSTGSFLLGMGVGLGLTFLLSVILAWLSLRLDPDGFGVMSIAVHLGALAVVLNWTSLTRGALGIPRIPRFPFLESTADFAVVSVLVAALWAALLWWMQRGSFGRCLAALSEHEWHASSLGIRRHWAHFIAFMLAGIGAFLTNVLFHQYIFLVHPSDFAFPYMIFMVMVIVAGNPGSILGCAFSLVLLSALREGMRFVPLSPAILGPTRLILFGLILLLAVWWRRDRLFPAKREI